jgi:hypothetical protein
MEKPLKEKSPPSCRGVERKKEINTLSASQNEINKATNSFYSSSCSSYDFGVDRREFQTGLLSLPYKKKEGDVQAIGQATLKKRQPYSSRPYSNYSYMPIGQMNGPWPHLRKLAAWSRQYLSARSSPKDGPHNHWI